MIPESPPPSFEDINFSSTAFAEDTCELEHAHGNVWTVKRRLPDDDEDDPIPDEFGELHLNQGLDGIVRLDALRRKKSACSKAFCFLWMGLILLTVLIVVSLVRVPPTKDEANAQSLNAYDEQVHTIYQYLIKNQISSSTTLQQAGSPHYEAVHWMAVHPGATELGSYPFLVRYVLVLTFLTVGGPLFSFDSSVCDWFSKDGQPGVECEESGLPIALQFDNRGLSGQLPTELGWLTTLQRVSLGQNALKGSLPSELCRLTELQRLNVHSNQINGTVPSCFSSLPQLQILNLNFNQMTGALPLMTNLTELYLNMNDISQDLPTLVASMPHLKVLSARENRFYGDIELAFDHLAEQLVLLDLMGNQQLGGAFPHKLLYHAPQLEILSLGDNAISGKLTWSIPYNDKLRFLSIHSNDLEGILPPAITNLTALTHLIAHHNHFTGPLPQTLSTNLRSLFLSDNPFTAGPLPDEWASLSSMVAFHIGGSDRTGDLPAWLGQNWTQLELLDMSRNNFTGGIPESWGELPQLEYLFLSHNGQITGPLPESFQSLSNLKQAFLLETGIAGNWQFMCQHEASKVSVLVSNAEDCSCCVLCVDADCANNDMSLSESFEWKYRSYWGP